MQNTIKHSTLSGVCMLKFPNCISFWMPLVLVQYHIRNTCVQKQVNFLWVKITLTHQRCNNSKSLICLGILLRKLEKQPQIDLWVKRSRVNLPATCWLHFILQTIFTLLNYRYFRLCKKKMNDDDWKTLKTSKDKKVVGQVQYRMLPDRVLCLPSCVNCGRIGVPCMWSVMKVWWTFYVLEYSHSIASIYEHR